MVAFVKKGKRWSKKLREALEKSGWIITDNPIEADVVFSDEVHVYKPTVCVESDKIKVANYDNIIDILIPSDIRDDIIMLRTKLYEVYLNIGDFESFLEEEFSKSIRYTLPLTLIVFKILKDEDEVAKKLFSIFKRYSRKADKIFRLSFDEVAVVLPGTDLEGGEIFIKRLLKRLNREFLRSNTLKMPNIVYGSASIEEWMISSEDLISTAEFKLLQKIGDKI